MSKTAKQSVTIIVALVASIVMGYLVWSFSVTAMQDAEPTYPFDFVDRGLSHVPTMIRRPAAVGTERIEFNSAMR